MKNTSLGLEYKTLRRFRTFVKLCALTTCLLFLFCKNETKQSQKLALTPTITAVQDTTIKIEQRAPSTQQPEGMLLVKGGYTFVGSDSSGLIAENPRFWIYVQPFYMDISPVTVVQFWQFVQATSYKTEAENFGNGGFIDETSKNAWILKDGCTWQYPNGKDYPAAFGKALFLSKITWRMGIN